MKNLKRFLPRALIIVVVLFPIVTLVDLWLYKKIINVQRQQTSPVAVTFGVSTNPNDDGICIEIDAAPLWERGIDSDELDTHIRENAQVLVDGWRVPNDEIQYWSDMMDSIEAEPGRILGSHGGHRTLCFDGGILSYGAHTLILRTESISGSLAYEDIWTFETIGQIPSGNPIPLPTPALISTITPTR